MSQEELISVEEAFSTVVEHLLRDRKKVEALKDRLDGLFTYLQEDTRIAEVQGALYADKEALHKQNQEIELLKRRVSDHDVRFDGHSIALQALDQRCEAFNKRIENLVDSYYKDVRELRIRATDLEERMKAVENTPDKKPAVDTDHEQINRELEEESLLRTINEESKWIDKSVFYTPPGPASGQEFHKLNKEIEQLSKDRYKAQQEADKYKNHLHNLCAAVCGGEFQHYAYDLVAKDAARHREERSKYKTMWERLKKSTTRLELIQHMDSEEMVNGIHFSSQEKPLRKLGE